MRNTLSLIALSLLLVPSIASAQITASATMSHNYTSITGSSNTGAYVGFLTESPSSRLAPQGRTSTDLRDTFKLGFPATYCECATAWS